ncbi:MAG TPA: class I SAM-dependent rRNA methyltransferase [Candidatus Limnocylindria bacterium]|nr:class I SAM-dependent rRNA methyltransferase [Candidatus Limnocylindria bacterium]
MAAESEPPAPSVRAVAGRVEPWVHLKYQSHSPIIYPAMVREASPNCRPGDWVHVYDRDGQYFGEGLWNPRARVPLRILRYSKTPAGEEFLDVLLNRAIDFRVDTLRLPETTDAFRVIHSDGDSLSGLIIDKFGDVLSIQIHSLGIAQRLKNWIPRLHERLGTKRVVVEVDPDIARTEGISPKMVPSEPVRSVKIQENGIRYEVDFAEGHKTGFFCDQRENRKKLASMVKDKRVLDLCCYTGGFGISAKIQGGASEVIGVDLDEAAIAQAKRNANLNQARVTWVHCDAFSYARQMQKNSEGFDVVICDPPKLIHTREIEIEGIRRYEDLNALAMTLLKPGGILVTCSCSGMLPEEEFERIMLKTSYRLSRRLQFFDRTGPGADHPVMSNCLEGRYLKLYWMKVWE